MAMPYCSTGSGVPSRITVVEPLIQTLARSRGSTITPLRDSAAATTFCRVVHHWERATMTSPEMVPMTGTR